jgi:hypothetical protein
MPSSPAPKNGGGERLDNEWQEVEEKGISKLIESPILNLMVHKFELSMKG